MFFPSNRLRNNREIETSLHATRAIGDHDILRPGTPREPDGKPTPPLFGNKVVSPKQSSYCVQHCRRCRRRVVDNVALNRGIVLVSLDEIFVVCSARGCIVVESPLRRQMVTRSARGQGRDRYGTVYHWYHQSHSNTTLMRGLIVRRKRWKVIPSLCGRGRATGPRTGC